MSIINFQNAVQARAPHVTAPVRCAACDHAWQAVVPAPPPRDGLECPKCGAQTDALAYAQVYNALEVLDDLRERVRKGQLVAVVAVGITEDDATTAWATATQPVSRLRVMGALSHLLHMYQHGEIDE